MGQCKLQSTSLMHVQCRQTSFNMRLKQEIWPKLRAEGAVCRQVAGFPGQVL